MNFIYIKVIVFTCSFSILNGLKLSKKTIVCKFLSECKSIVLNEGFFFLLCSDKWHEECLWSPFFWYFSKEQDEYYYYVGMCPALSINKFFGIPQSPHNVFTCHPPPHSHIHMNALQRLVPCVLTCTYETRLFWETTKSKCFLCSLITRLL